MNDDRQELPHFLRVVRSIANVRSPVIPLAAVFTTVVGSAGCGVACNGFCGGGFIGTGGEGTTTHFQTGTTTMDAGFVYDGGPVGDMTMPDGGDGGDDGGDGGP